jgi:membrane protease YdiL (CAAX protease family)
VELLPVPFIVTANVAVGKQWGNGATAMLGGFFVGLLALFGLADMLGLPLLSGDFSPQARFALDAGTVVTAAAAAGFLIRPIRKDVAAVIPIDPDNPVHTIALVFATVLLGIQVTSIAFTDVLATSNAQPPLTILDLFEDELPFLFAAIVGVGLFIRRDVPTAASRLGLVLPRWWHIALALACTGIFFGFGQASDLLSNMFTPQLAHRVDATTQHVFGQLVGPAGIVAVALIPGICEEVLFRGALQPRLGLVFTALLFTSIHTEYGLSLDTLTVFLIALGLGLIRKYTNTTASCVCHVSYNLLVGIGIGAALLNAALIAEAVLVAVTAYAIWAERRRRAPATD